LNDGKVCIEKEHQCALGFFDDFGLPCPDSKQVNYTENLDINNE